MKKTALPKARVVEIRKSIWRIVNIEPGCLKELPGSNTPERPLLIEAAKVASNPCERQDILLEIAELQAKDYYGNVVRSLESPAAKRELRRIKGCGLLRTCVAACALFRCISWLLFLALGILVLTWHWWLLYPLGIAWAFLGDFVKVRQIRTEVELASRLRVFRELRQGEVACKDL